MPTVLVTGASHGIGRAVAAAFAGATPPAAPSNPHEAGDAGAGESKKNAATRLALVSRDENLLRETRRICRDRGAEAEYFLCDVTDEQTVASVAGLVRERWGVPDVVVNNAGVFAPGSVRSMTVETFRNQIEANLTSAFIVTHAFLNEMIERGSGHLFYMCSVASLQAYPRGVAYGAAKHGLLGLARAVREETKESGIRVTAVMPGATYTRSWQSSDLPEERFMRPEDVGRTVLDAYLLSRRSVVEEILLRPQLGDI